MEVAIFTEGSKEIGFGHLTRSLSLAQALRGVGLKAKFYLGGDRFAEDFLQREGFEVEVFPRLEDIEKIPRGWGAFVDSYLAGEEFYREVSERFERKVYLDDFFRLDYPAGAILNYVPALEVPWRYRNRELLWGEKYHLIRRPFWEVPQKLIRKGVSKIMVTFGGDDIRNLTPRVVKALLNRLKGVQIHTVVGAGFRNVEHLEELARQHPDRVFLHYNLNGEGMKNLMLEADIAVSAGGQTLFELARVGTPTVAVGVADNQFPNLRGFSERGFLNGFLWWDQELLQEQLIDAVEKLLPFEERKRKSSLGRSLIDGKGPKRVAEYFLP